MDNPWLEFDYAVCRWIVKLAPYEELPEAAVAAMVAGCDTPSLTRLALMDGRDMVRASPGTSRHLRGAGA